MADDSIASHRGLRRTIRRLLRLSDDAQRPEDTSGADAAGSASQGLADRSPLRLAYEVGRAFAGRLQLEELIPFAIDRCREVLDAEGVAVLLYDRETDELYFPYAAEQDPAVAARILQIRFPADRGIAGAVLRSRTSLRVDDASADPRFFPGVDQQMGQTTRALLCAPLLSPAGVIGVIEAVNLRGTAVFTDDDLALLDGLAESLAAAIHNARSVQTVGAKRQEDKEQGAEVADQEEAGHRSGEGLKPGGVFRREGEYWTIEFEGAVARLKDAKGLHYLAHLLRYPGQEFHVRDLVALDVEPRPESPGVADPSRQQLGDAGAVLDAQAKAAYKRRLEELREELEEAERFNDPGRSTRAREEIEAITDQLSAAVGLGGRDRKAASDAERARLAVTKRIKAALERIHQAHPALARHLSSAITTGYFCSYAPKADTSAAWSL